MGRGNQKGGKKHKRGKKEGYESKALRLKEDGQEYAQITACKGNCRFDVKCFDGKDRIAILCGKMRKRYVPKFLKISNFFEISKPETQTFNGRVLLQIFKRVKTVHIQDQFFLNYTNRSC